MIRKYFKGGILKPTIVLVVCLLSISVIAWARPRVEELLLQGNSLCGRGKYKEAVDIYKQALREYNSADAAYNLGITYEINLRDMRQALDYYQRFLSLEPGSDDTRLVKGWIEEIEAAYFPKVPPKPKKLEELSSRLKQLIIDDLKLAREFYQHGKYEAAVKKYLEVLEVYDSAGAAYNLGLIYDKKLNQKQKAIEYYQQFLFLEPSSPDKDIIRQWIKQAREALNKSDKSPQTIR